MCRLEVALIFLFLKIIMGPSGLSTWQKFLLIYLRHYFLWLEFMDIEIELAILVLSLLIDVIIFY